MTDVINQMLNDESKDMRYKKIFIHDIEPLALNKYPMQDIEQLAQNISEVGLLHPITLYEIEKDKYVILSGERRYRAMLYNYEHGDERWEEVPSLVKTTKLDERHLKRLIRRGNANRESLTKELKLEIIKEALADYEISKRENEVPKGMLKRDWISMDTGISARTVQDFLTIIKNETRNTDDQELKIKETKEFTGLERKFCSRLKIPVKISNNKIILKIKNEEDLARIMEILGVEE